MSLPCCHLTSLLACSANDKLLDAHNRYNKQYLTVKKMKNRSGRDDYFTVMAEDYQWTGADGEPRQGPDYESAWDLLVSHACMTSCTSNMSWPCMPVYRHSFLITCVMP